MGKSIKKTPIVKNDGKSKKEWKKIASHSLRQKLKNPEYGVDDFAAFKKEFETYTIADYSCHWSKEDATVFYNRHCDPNYYCNKNSPADRGEKAVNEWLEHYPTLEDFLRYWEKVMLHK